MFSSYLGMLLIFLCFCITVERRRVIVVVVVVVFKCK